MNVSSAFDNYQRVVNADEEAIREARRRRDLFKDAFSPAADVTEVIASGSLRRGTHRDPIHDVDVVIVFDGDHHPTWGQPGASAEEALHYTRGKVNALLGASHGTFAKEVRLAKWRNHAVKCFLDDREDSDAFTVDAMPALRSEGKLLIPEAKSKTWVLADPEHLIESVAAKHKAWNQFAGSVRMLKAWGAVQDIKVKSLVMEVLALHHMPTSQIRPVAMKNFFVKAAFHIEGGMPVEDPAGICGPIQTDLKYVEFGERLRAAAKAASLAVAAQASNNDDAAVTYWGEVFGDDFPKPPKSTSAPAAVAALPRPVKDTPQG